MVTNKTVKTDSLRQQELDSYAILDTLPKKQYDDIAKLASYICNVPISLITMIDRDRQWFMSHPNVDMTETPREYSFCAHAIKDPNTIMEVQDLRKDERFTNNPFVVNDPNVVFYAGAPLVTKNGQALGTICVLDTKENKLTQDQKNALTSLASQVVHLLELHKTTNKLQHALAVLDQKNTTLEQFAQLAAHDLKSPLSSIILLVDVLGSYYTKEVDPNALQCIQDLNQSATNLSLLIDGILQYSKNHNFLLENPIVCNLDSLLKEVVGFYANNKDCEFIIKHSNPNIICNQVALKRILINLVSNAVKYGVPPKTIITITVKEAPDSHIFTVEDNGPGIKESAHSKIFETFSTLQHEDRYGIASTGIGLSTVKDLVEGMDGTITLDSQEGSGTVFQFTLPKRIDR